MGVSWALYSKTDPRWDCNGYIKEPIPIAWDDEGLPIPLPDIVQKKLKELTKKYKVKPKDLEYSCMKD